MLRKTGKWISTMVIMALLTMAAGITAFAADQTIDLNAQGSIRIMPLENGKEHKPVAGGTITVYHVADAVIQNASMTYQPTAEFADCGIGLVDVAAEGLAEHLAGYAAEQQVTGTTKDVEAETGAVFEQLSTGLYLVVQSESAEGYYPMASFVVSIPMMNADRTGWVYEIDASPKTEVEPEKPDMTQLTVKKVWKGTDKNRPQQVTVQLLQNGKPYQTIRLNDQNNWSYTWKELDSRCRWSIVEVNVPNGYKVQYSQAGTTLTITNTIGPETPDTPPENPPLIQTGQLNWPIPVLAGVGALLLLTGWILSQGKRNQHES